MPAIEPDEDPIIVEFDIPVPAYLDMLSAVKERGFPTLEAYLYHLVEQLTDGGVPAPRDSGD